MKKRIALAAGVLSLLLITGCSSSDFDYTVSNELVTVKGYKNETLPIDLVIPNEINKKSVAFIDSKAFCNQSSIRTVALPASLKKIRRGAFENCINLSEVVIPSSVTELENCSFKGVQQSDFHIDEQCAVGNQAGSIYELHLTARHIVFFFNDRYRRKSI